MKPRIYHIINPVSVTQGSDLFVAQPVTFETFKIAKSNIEDVQVVQCTAQYAEDVSIIPQFYLKTKNLKRSVADFRGSGLSRKLPLIKDILKRAYKLSRRGDYIIYSNVDIALKPHFYQWVNTQIQDGYDAFVVNRRTISSKYSSPNELQLMFEEEGEAHPGYDCFIFKRDILKKMVLHNICIGAVYIGLALFLNLKLFAKKFHEFRHEHLTFHIGDDQVWKSPDNNPYAEHNKMEFEKIKIELSRKYGDIHEILDSAFPSLKHNSTN